VIGERRCLVVGSDPAITAGVAAVVDATPGLVCSGVLEPAAAISGLRPGCEAVIACDAAGHTALELAEPLIRACPGVPVILATAEADTAAYRAALAVGARGLLGLPPDQVELARSVTETAGQRSESSVGPQAGRVVAVCSAKGGCGSSAFAAELAHAGRGLLIDLAEGFDDAALRLGCSARRSLSDVAGLDDDLGADALRSLVSTHPAGMGLVARSSDVTAAEVVTPALARALVRESRAVSSLTLIDLGVVTSENAMAVALSADRAMLVTTAEPAVVDCAARSAAWLERRGVPGGMVELVVNRWSRGSEMSVRGIERVVGLPVVAVLRDGDLSSARPGRRDAVADLARRLVSS
jgi:pilus assembly protein CpaE